MRQKRAFLCSEMATHILVNFMRVKLLFVLWWLRLIALMKQKIQHANGIRLITRNSFRRAHTSSHLWTRAHFSTGFRERFHSGTRVRCLSTSADLNKETSDFKTMTLNTTPSGKVCAVKHHVEGREGIPPYQQQQMDAGR